MSRNVNGDIEKGQATGLSDLALDASAFFEAADLLEDCREEMNRQCSPRRLPEALQLNLRLWKRMRTSVARPHHQLPQDIRTDLLRLSEFVERKTRIAVSQCHPRHLQDLIDINRQIGMGLTAALS